MRIQNKYLDILSQGHPRILVFDCEFWHVLGKSGDSNIIYDKGKDFFFIPREIGGFILTKRSDGWEYTPHFYVTLDRPKGRDVAFPISHFATVTPQTGWKLDEIEQQLSLPWGDAYSSRLPPEERTKWEEGIRLYENDSNIMGAHRPTSWYSKFLKVYSESIVIVKGTKDIESIQNACQIYGIKYVDPAAVNDIGVWNPTSRKQCGSAKLEETFKCVKDQFDDDTGNGNRIRDILPLGKSHDPSVDASMTLLVALYIISKRP